jgi:hypothetical protein
MDPQVGAQLKRLEAMITRVALAVGEIKREESKAAREESDTAAAVAAIGGASRSLPSSSPKSHSLLEGLASAIGHVAKPRRVSVSVVGAATGDEDDEETLKLSPEETDSPAKDDAVAGALDGHIYPDVVRSVAKHHGTFKKWVARLELKSNRNKHEMDTLCAALDKLLTGSPEDGVDILVRRLMALQQVESGKSWSVAKALEASDIDHPLPRTVLRAALREAALQDKFEKAGKSKDDGKSSTKKKSSYGASWESSFNSAFGGGRGRGGGRGGGDRSQSRGGASSSAGGRGSATPAQ